MHKDRRAERNEIVVLRRIPERAREYRMVRFGKAALCWQALQTKQSGGCSRLWVQFTRVRVE